MPGKRKKLSPIAFVKKEIVSDPTSIVAEDKSLSRPRSAAYAFAEGFDFANDAFQYASILEKVWDEREMIGLCRKMVKWVANPLRDLTNYKIIQFLMANGISRHDVAGLKKKWPVFARTHEFVKQTLGNHREWMGLHHEWDVKMVMFTMPTYDPDWSEESVRLAKLKSIEVEERGMQVVHIPVYVEKDKDEVD
jgi:hypothetical protein